MKRIIRKSAIPESKTFIVKNLRAAYFDPSWHFHPEYQLFVVMKGKGTRFIGDNIRPFVENDMVFTSPNLPHLWRNYDGYFKDNIPDHTWGIVIYFQPDFLGKTIYEKEEFENIHLLFQRAERGLEITGETNKIISKMMIKLLNLKGVSSVIQLLEILNLLANSSECHPIAHAGYTNLNKESETKRMNLIYEYVMKNFRSKVSLVEVAELSNMSISSFSRYFKSRVNKSFSDFLSEIRIGNSCRMLHEEGLNISQISYESGFSTLSNFNKQFKKVTGTTPLQYRKTYLASISNQ